MEQSNIFKGFIILVEDDAALAETIETVLTRAGHEVAVAVDSHELFTLLDARLPDLIVSDVRLGIEDGKELCLQIKLNPRYKHIPVLLTTAFSLTDWEVDSFMADAYLPKPFEISDLETQVSRLLQKYKKQV